MHYSIPFLIVTIVTVASGPRFPTANLNKQEVTYGNNPKSILYYSLFINASELLQNPCQCLLIVFELRVWLEGMEFLRDQILPNRIVQFTLTLNSLLPNFFFLKCVLQSHFVSNVVQNTGNTLVCKELTVLCQSTIS